MPEQPLAAAPAPVAPAAPSAPAVPAPAAEAAFRPRTWWQWILLYPAFALALLTAFPQWLDRALAFAKGIHDMTNSEAMEMNSLFIRNMSCTGAPYQYYREPVQGRIIDATLCPSGDLYVRVLVPDESSKLATVIDGQLFRETSQFVSIDKVVEQFDKFASQYEQHAALGLFSMAADAATLPQSRPQGKQDDLILVQDQFALVICQKFTDERMLLRHIQVQNQCFDEIVDTYTGVTASRVPVPCRSTC
jgi:hypothetical protein